MLQITDVDIPCDDTASDNFWPKNLRENRNKSDWFSEYIRRMSVDGEWGDGIVLSYAVKLYKRKIQVVLTNGHTISFDPMYGSENSEAEPIFMGFVTTTGSSDRNHYVHLDRKTTITTETPPGNLNGGQ